MILPVTMVVAKTDGVIRRRRARIPSWLEAAPSLHSEAAYIEADRFFHTKLACNQVPDL